MRALLALLFATTTMLSTPVRAEDFSGFYRWVENVVVKSEIPGVHQDGLATVIIRVKNSWGDPTTPEMFRHWLPTQMVYTVFALDVRKAEAAGSKGFRVHVILADTSVRQENALYSWIPASADLCEAQLTFIDERVRGK